MLHSEWQSINIVCTFLGRFLLKLHVDYLAWDIAQLNKWYAVTYWKLECVSKSRSIYLTQQIWNK